MIIVVEWLCMKFFWGGSVYAIEFGIGTILSFYGVRFLFLGIDEENDYMMGFLVWIVVRDVLVMMENFKGFNVGVLLVIFVFDCGGGMCESYELKRFRAFSLAVKRSEVLFVIFVVLRDNMN